MKTAYVSYHNRSCVSGRALVAALNELQAGGYKWRPIIHRRKMKHPAALLLRWGDSSDWAVPRDFPSQEAILNATRKQQMMETMKRSGVPVPPLVLNENPATFVEEGIELARINGHEHAYIRGANDSVRFDSVYNLQPNDQYMTLPLRHGREFRVHVYEGRVIGLYEKLPYAPDIRLYKNDTCRFKRLDLGDDEVRKACKGVRPAAKAAVESLGLPFGGVDVIQDVNGQVFVTEVNSAPSLNSLNLKRWAENIANTLQQM